MEKEYWCIKTFLLYLNKYPTGMLPEFDADEEIVEATRGDMNEELMTTGSTPGAAGFSGNAAATGPVAGLILFLIRL